VTLSFNFRGKNDRLFLWNKWNIHKHYYINLDKTRLQRLLAFKFIPTTGKVNVIKVALKKSIHSEQGPHERTFPWLNVTSYIQYRLKVHTNISFWYNLTVNWIIISRLICNRFPTTWEEREKYLFPVNTEYPNSSGLSITRGVPI